jgi:hypothetical protein
MRDSKVMACLFSIARTHVESDAQYPYPHSTHSQALADRLGLQRHPLRAGGVISTIVFTGRATAAEVLAQPLTVQLLAGPGNVAVEFTLPVVLVLPLSSESDNQLFELQLGLFDFCATFKVDWLPLWASQFMGKETGERFALPVVAPRPPHIYMRLLGTSTFHITHEAYEGGERVMSLPLLS